MSPTIKKFLLTNLQKHFVIISTIFFTILIFGCYKILNLLIFKIVFLILCFVYIVSVIYYHTRYHHPNDKFFERKSNENNFTTFILHSFFKNIRESLELRDLIDIIIENITKILNCEGCILYLIDNSDSRYYIRGDNRGSSARRDIIFSDKSLLCKFLYNNKSIILDEYLKDKLEEKVFEFIDKYMILMEARVLVPIFFDESLLGFIFLCNKKNNEKYTNKDLDTLKIISSEISIGLKNAMSYNELKKNYIQTIDALVMTMEARDLTSKGHKERTQYWAVEIGKKLDLTRRDIEIIRCAGILHDISKISGENSDILDKSIIQDDVISPIDFLDEVKAMIKNQYEQNLRNTEQNPEIETQDAGFLTKILKLAELFDEMLNSKKFYSINEILEEINNINVKDFSEEIVDALKEVVRNTHVNILDTSFENIEMKKEEK